MLELWVEFWSLPLLELVLEVWAEFWPLWLELWLEL
jgi:hypothetical protein